MSSRLLRVAAGLITSFVFAGSALACPGAKSAAMSADKGSSSSTHASTQGSTVKN